jgi:16S rRNA processing protein RimM
VRVELHTDFPARFQLLDRVWLAFPDGRRESFELENCWEHQGRLILKFGSIDSISDAERLAGAWVEIEAEQAVPLPQDTYWDRDLVGCSLRDRAGNTLGVVTEVMRIMGNSQLVVRGDKGEFMVPMAASICIGISIARKEILVDLPEGLVDLNQ